jgi:hypothetical protein
MGPHSQIHRTPTFILFRTQVASTLEHAVCEWPLIESERPLAVVPLWRQPAERRPGALRP